MRRLAMCACSIVLLGSPALADDEPLRIKGQKIDSDHFGPSIIEPMSVAVARDQARPAGEMLNPKARNGAHGQWVIPSRGGTCRPCSGDHYATNKWGDTRMGIGFGELVDLHGAYIGGQSGPGVWTTELLGTTSGFWERCVPIDDPLWNYDPSSDGDGSGQCWLTENQNNPDYPEPFNTDVDDGSVRLTSPTLDMAGGGGISYHYFLRLTEQSGIDQLLVEINSDDGAGPWVEIARHDSDGALQWRLHEISGDELLALGIEMTSLMRVRFTANDDDPQSINEAGVDGFRVTVLVCDDDPNADLNGDGEVGPADLAILLGAWGECAAEPPCVADLNGDGVVGPADLAILLALWG